MGRPDTRHSNARSLSLSSDTTSKRHMSSDTGSLRTVTTASGSSDDTLLTGPDGRPKPMWFAEMNPFAPESIVLLHILFSCHLEWKQVWPKLAEYHLLVPDLPCHSHSRGVCRKDEFSVELCADLVADLIRRRAHDGRAHLVGLSTGGFVAMEMLRRHPGVVKSAMVAGAWPLAGVQLKTANHPRLTWAALWSILHSPGYMFFKASGLGGEYQNDELLAEIKRNGSLRLLKAASVSDWKEDRLDFGGRGIPLCFVAGAKFDNVDEAHRAVQVLRAQQQQQQQQQQQELLQEPGTKSERVPLYAIRDGIHAWNLQYPLVFARGIRAFIEGRPMPVEFDEVH